jgi:hypothetical protein
MLMSTAARIWIPAPYAGTNRVRFNGFAESSSIRCPASQAIAGHPKVH